MILDTYNMDEIVYFWGGWESILRILVVGTITYIGIIVILRISGKRTLASMNAYDFIITIAMGSAFGRILTAQTVSVSEALVTFLLLVFLNFLFSFFESRSKIFKKLVTSQPTLLFYNGNFLEKNIRKERLRKRDLIGAARKKQFGDLDGVEAIILETDGTFSVIKKSETGKDSTYNELLKS